MTPDTPPTIIIDSREQTPLTFSRLPSIGGTLTTGDYSFAGGEELFSIERKSIPDLVACCMGNNRERFERELHRLRGFRFKRLLVIGTRQEIEAGNYRSNIPPAAVLHTLSAFECRYDCPVVFAPSSADAAKLVESWAFWFSREITKTFEAFTKGATIGGCQHTPSPEIGTPKGKEGIKNAS
jgi:DNA excision repair protein ERCC-4